MNQDDKPVAQGVTQQAAKAETPTAWLATDLDGRGDVAFTKEEAKRRAGEGCTEFFPLYDLAPTTSTVSASGALAAADDVRDAGRYRWLRERNNNLDAVTEAGAILFGKRLDQAIDAEMQMTTAAGAGSAQPEAPSRDTGQEEASTQTVPSIGDDPKFNALLIEAHGDIRSPNKWGKLIAYIDGRTAGTGKDQ